MSIRSLLPCLLQSTINAASSFKSNGSTVSVSVDGAGKLVINSSKYGSVTNLSLSSVAGTAVSDVFGNASPVAGVDVVGSLGGVIVTGSGQTLTGAGGTDADGLKVEVTGGATGDRGFVNYSQGYAHGLNALAGTFLG